MRRAPLLPLLIALVTGALAGPGCMASSREELIRISREVNADLRWGRIEHVLPRMAPALRARFQAQMAALGEDVEFLDHEVLGLELGRGPKDRDRAVGRVDLTWTDRRTGLVQRATVLETWEWSGRDWFLTRMVRMRGAPLPLFEEPPEAPPPKEAPTDDGPGSPDGGPAPA